MVDSPSGGAPEKAPRWDLMGTEGCGAGNRVSWCSWMFSWYVDLTGKEVGQGSHEGPTRVGDAPSCLVAASAAS